MLIAKSNSSVVGLPWSALSCIESKFVEILGQKYQQRRKTWRNITKNEKKIGLKYIMERRRSCSHHNEPRRTSLRQKLCNRGNLWNQRNAGCRDFRSVVFVCPRDSLNFSDVDVLSTLGFGGWARIRLRGQRLKEEKWQNLYFHSLAKNVTHSVKKVFPWIVANGFNVFQIYFCGIGAKDDIFLQTVGIWCLWKIYFPQDRRQGNPEWSWANTYKEFPTGDT